MIRFNRAKKTYDLHPRYPHTLEEVAALDAKYERIAPGELRWFDPADPPAEQVVIRFDEATRTLWLPKVNKVLEGRLDQEYERIPGQLRWKVPDDGVTFARAINFGKAKLSGKHTPDDPTVLQRVASCTPCEALKRNVNGGWCQTCGCGAKTLMLNADGTPADKMLYKTLNCPLFKKGFTNALGGQEG